MWHDDLEKLRRYIQRKMEEIEEEIETLISRENNIVSDEEYMRLDIKEPLHTIYDMEDRYVIVIDLPWVDPEKILINAIDNRIEIKAKLKKTLKTTDVGYKFISEALGEYQKIITIPPDSNVSELTYRMKQGRLIIEVPKTRKKN